MKARHAVVLGFLALVLVTALPASAAIDELAFGTTPEVMVYLFAVNEVATMPDSPYTTKRVDAAVKFCRGKVSDHLVQSLVGIQGLLKQKKFKQAQDQAKMLLAQTYGE